MSKNTSNIFFVQPISSNTSKASDVESSKDKASIRSYKPPQLQIPHNQCKFRSIWGLIPSINVNWKFSDAFYGLFALVIVIIAPVSITLLPTRNVLTSPEYWYEILYSSTSLSIFLAAIAAIELKTMLGENFKEKATWIAVDLFVHNKVVDILAYCMIHLFWTEILGYYDPFPLRQTLVGYLSGIALFTRCWYVVPNEIRIDSSLRFRLKAFICYSIWSIIVLLKLIFFRGVLAIVPRDFQWMVALTVPLMKEIDDRITTKIMAKVPSPENSVETKVIGNIQTNLVYSYWIAFALTNDVTKATECLLLGINFSINLWLCYKVIQLDRKVSGTDGDGNEKEKKEALAELILNEFVEVLVPIAFLGTYSMAYYGPNKDTIGNLGCEIWRFKKMERLQESLCPVAEMALIDTGSLILAGISLWWFCKINLWHEYCLTIRKYWIYMAFRGGLSISVWFCGMSISAANDYTWKFDWIQDDDERAKFLSNLTCIAHI